MNATPTTKTAVPFDLIVTAYTAIAHLAGAPDRTVELALRPGPDWRWFLHGNETFWYPRTRLFRQTERDDGVGVFARIEAQLVEEIGCHASGRVKVPALGHAAFFQATRNEVLS